MLFEHVMAVLGKQPRSQQTRLIEMIDRAQDEPLAVQAGTGVGKSYVVLYTAARRALETGKPSVVVCPTNALVGQYINKDAPVICEATGTTFTYIKGRNRYMCTNAREMRRMGNDAAAELYENTLLQRGTVDLDELGMKPEEWGCPGSKSCKQNETCGAVEARKHAAKFNIIITNAHVLVWDQRVRDFTGDMASLLPDYGALLVDECHELDAVTRDCLSDEIGLNSRIYDLLPEFKMWVLEQTKEIENDIPFEPNARMVELKEEAEKQVARLDREIHIERKMDPPDFDSIKVLEQEQSTWQRFVDLFNVQDADGPRFIVKLTPDHLVCRVCVDASSLTGRILRGQPSVLLSGTVPGSMLAQLGIRNAQTGDVGHPFNYGQSQIRVSKFSPNDIKHRMPRIEELAQSILQARGGTLVLFTSWSDLELVMPKVHERLAQLGAGDIPIYLQSREDPADTRKMIEEFREHGNGVLAGVRTLFTGIDIPGSALRQVVLWKLPYPVPSLEFKAMEDIHGRDVYWSAMKVALVQGIGRLVRTVDDRGRVVILDNRAAKQRWGADPLTRHLNEFRRA